MTFHNRLATIALACAFLSVGGCSSGSGDAASVVLPAGPELDVPEAQLAEALNCPEVFQMHHDPVLMIHGTWSNPDLDWSWTYVPTLTARGYDVCTVDLDGSMRDIQQSTEYVVYAIREAAQRSGRRVAVVGYSQGALQGRWAIRWWPDVQQIVSHYISLAGVHHGVPLAQTICVAACSPALWQMLADSMFLGALNSGDPTPGDLPYTSIWSSTDTTAEPPTSILEGAASIAVQDICPGRQVSHTQIISDAIAFALVLDALSHSGPASSARVDPALCAQTVAEGMDENKAATREQDGVLVIPVYEAGSDHPTAEPELAAYAR
jgi:triacylglycerol lipase